MATWTWIIGLLLVLPLLFFVLRREDAPPPAPRPADDDEEGEGEGEEYDTLNFERRRGIGCCTGVGPGTDRGIVDLATCQRLCLDDLKCTAFDFDGCAGAGKCIKGRCVTYRDKRCEPMSFDPQACATRTGQRCFRRVRFDDIDYDGPEACWVRTPEGCPNRAGQSYRSALDCSTFDKAEFYEWWDTGDRRGAGDCGWEKAEWYRMHCGGVPAQSHHGTRDSLPK